MHKDSVRAFKQRMKLGRFADTKSNSESSISDTSSAAEGKEDDSFSPQSAKMKIGDRCEVEPETGGLKKRGEIKFIGLTNFKPGFWVGIQYDEPLGKHDGT